MQNQIIIAKINLKLLPNVNILNDTQQSNKVTVRSLRLNVTRISDDIPFDCYEVIMYNNMFYSYT